MKIYLEILLLIIAVLAFGSLFFTPLNKTFQVLIFGGGQKLFNWVNSANILFAPSSEQSGQNQVCFGRQCFFVELAKTEAEREKGLMYKTYLNKNAGMLFIFNKEGIYPFWMKNTLISLDIIWIDGNNEVVFISHDAQPCKSLICPTINPSAKAKYVLEINAGMAKKTGFKAGDSLELKIVN